MTSPRKRLSELLDATLDEGCPVSSRKELDSLVEEHRGLVKELAAQLRMHSFLQWQSGAWREVVAAGVKSRDKSMSGRKGAFLNWGGIASHSSTWIAATVLLCFSGVGGYFLWQHSQVQTVTIPIVAEIVSDEPIEWTQATTAIKDRLQVVPGRLEMEAGTVTLRFRSGATMTASGRVSLSIESDMLVKLEKGHATTHVPEWAHGFTVETSNAKVVDLGTVFGVDARLGGHTDIVVFEGEVDVTPSKGKLQSTTRLTQGEAARVDSGGSLSRIVEVHQGGVQEAWSTNTNAFKHSLISSVSDNIKPDESAKFYEIVPRGFVEDCPAYVDRHHQWNGLSSEGLPPQLRNADYVRTFNDYKYRDDLQVRITLEEPAEIYIMFDERVAIPEWLKRQFEETDMKVGLDEGPWPEEAPTDPTLRTATGAGKSIDNVFSVWRRVCAKPETLILLTLARRTNPGYR